MAAVAVVAVAVPTTAAAVVTVGSRTCSAPRGQFSTWGSSPHEAALSSSSSHHPPLHFSPPGGHSYLSPSPFPPRSPPSSSSPCSSSLSVSLRAPSLPAYVGPVPLSVRASPASPHHHRTAAPLSWRQLRQKQPQHHQQHAQTSWQSEGGICISINCLVPTWVAERQRQPSYCCRATGGDSDSRGGGFGSSNSSGESGGSAGDSPEISSKLFGGASFGRKGSDGSSNVSSAASSEGSRSSNDGSSSGSAAPPQDVLLQAVSEASKLEGRTARTTNLVMGGTAEYGDDWLELDKKVNTYPSFRAFTAIGTGGDDFAYSMVLAVESVIGMQVPKWQVAQRESAQGRYISVKIGPIRMESSDQVRAVYEAMKKDSRMRYFL